MSKRQNSAKLPSEVIRLTTYAQLDLYLDKFAAGELGLVLLLGRHGTGKSEGVKRALGIGQRSESDETAAPGRDVLYVEGHMQPYGLYASLWEKRNCPVVLDDLDKLYADANCVRLLKPLCNTQRTKRLSWLTKLTQNADVPQTFTTSSSVILIANEWRTLNANVRALEDRAIILHFDPNNDEVHRQARGWLKDHEVYDFIAVNLPYIQAISMRHYSKGSQLRKAGLRDWRDSLLRMLIPDPRIAAVVSVLHAQSLERERDRVDRFIATTGYSKATYFRTKALLLQKAP
jgi:hypothetical protein